ncbi:MAG TPA: alkaline phosphatase family protein [Candidatus Dormibacteraeota bacterium]|nr:alkaline phosphatase family protein [Candidatus Dormibacteraeota bacterium]
MRSSNRFLASLPRRGRVLYSGMLLRVGKALFLFSLILIGTVYSAQNISGMFHTANGASQAFDYVTVILMENNGLCDIITNALGGCSGGGSAPYMTSLADNYSTATHYTAITHPSEPNYITLAGGDTYVSGDGNCCWQISNPNIIDRIEASGRTWKAFAEDATGSGTCSFTPPRVADHFPFMEFSDMNSASRCVNFQATTSPTDQEFLNVLNSPNPPNFLWLTPNDADNMHGGSVSTGDNYLANLVPKILNSSTFTTEKAALFVVFDEGSDNCSLPPSSQDCVYATWAGPVVKKTYTSNTSYDHYSFLKTLETVWNLPSFTSNDKNSAPMTEFFQGGAASTGPSSSSSSGLSLGYWTWIPIPLGTLVILSLAVVLIVRSRNDDIDEES